MVPNGGQEISHPIHPELALLCSKERHLAPKTSVQDTPSPMIKIISTGNIRSVIISPSLFSFFFFFGLTCGEDILDSHNVSARPSGHVASDCPDHKTNCIIRPAPLGTATFWPSADTCHSK